MIKRLQAFPGAFFILGHISLSMNVPRQCAGLDAGRVISSFAQAIGHIVSVGAIFD
jgi:hypothetical protein